MTRFTKRLIFAVGFFIAAINYVNADVFSIIKMYSGQADAVLINYVSSSQGVDQVFIALGFALVYCVIGGFLSMLGASLYLYICKILGVKNWLYKALKPDCE